ncbi:cell division protein FtsZ [soil metagenome]
MSINVATTEHLGPCIRVFGIGGAGGNAVAELARLGLSNVAVIPMNTDAQALRRAGGDRKLQLGRHTTGGLGAGSRCAIGKAAAEESIADIRASLAGADLCVIAAGMGGGTGTGAAPVIAAAARALGIVTVAIVTRPFHFEGARRAATADAGVEILAGIVDALVVVPNQNLFNMAGPAITFRTALRAADYVLVESVRAIVEIVSTRAAKHVGFAELRETLCGLGRAVLGVGESGAARDRAMRSAEEAIASPLLDDRLADARHVIIAISGGDDMGLVEMDEVVGRIAEHADPDAKIVWGATISEEMRGRIRVSVIAEGSSPGLPVMPNRAADEPSEEASWVMPAPPPPIDLADTVLARPSINAAAAPSATKVCRIVVREPIPDREVEEFLLTQNHSIARHHPSLLDRASSGAGGAWGRITGGRLRAVATQ